MTDERATRRRFLAASGVASAIGLSGCLRLVGRDDDGTATALQDSDGDGVIDSEDYAPRDPDVQREEQVADGDETPSTTATEPGTGAGTDPANSTASDSATGATGGTASGAISESFTGDAWTENWEYSGVTEADSYIVLGSDGRLRSKRSFDAAGRYRIRSTFKPRSPDFNSYKNGISFVGNNPNFVVWNEHNWYGRFRVKMWNKGGENRSTSFGEPNGTAKRTYEIEFDLDEAAVTRLQRDDREWTPGLPFSEVVRDTFDVIVGRETTDTGVAVELHGLSIERL